MQGYSPDPASLARHELPQWWDEGKFGIFIHWGPYAVPGRGGRGGASPYTAEWYWFAQNIAGPFAEAWQYHLDTYGPDVVYDDFIPEWQAENYDPAAWIRLFEQAGARYFVLTAKHHDGFGLWPSETTQRDVGEMGPGRDLVGELFAANSAAGNRLKPGLYYSVPEWLNPAPVPPEAGAFYLTPNTPDPFPGLAFLAFNGQFTPRNAYTQLPVPYTGYQSIADYAADHVRPQMRELIERYSPSIIWCDIGGLESYIRANEVIADYYNHALEHRPEGVVVNDRCGDSSTHRDYAVAEVSGVTEGEELHGRGETVQTMGFSWGYDSEETPADMRSVDELIDLLVNLVSRDSNLLLNVGPTADGRIPEWQAERLQGIGAWLAVNGEAIYGSRPWLPAQGPYRFTRNPETGGHFVVALEWPGEEWRIEDLDLDASQLRGVELLGARAPVRWQYDGQHLVVQPPGDGRAEAASDSEHAWVLRLF